MLACPYTVGMFTHTVWRHALVGLVLPMLVGCGSGAGSTEKPADSGASVVWAPPAEVALRSGRIEVNTDQGGTLLISPAAVDFGQVAPTSEHPATFVLQNAGSVPIRIVSAKASCACTTISDLAGEVIAPGASLDLDAAFIAPRQPEEKTSKVFVVIEGVQKTTSVELKGDVTLPIKAVPPYADALKGKQNGTILLRSLDGRPFKVLSSNGERPVYLGFDPAKDELKNQYQLAWSIAGMQCDAIPRWWVFETDRADCPLIPCRVRNECTGSKRDETRFSRYWAFEDYLLDGGEVQAGKPFQLEVDLTHMNPRGRGEIVAPQWSNVRLVRATNDQATATLASATLVDENTVLVRMTIVPAPDHRGLLYVPVVVITETGSGLVDVIAKVVQ